MTFSENRNGAYVKYVSTGSVGEWHLQAIPTGNIYFATKPAFLRWE